MKKFIKQLSLISLSISIFILSSSLVTIAVEPSNTPLPTQSTSPNPTASPEAVQTNGALQILKDRQQKVIKVFETTDEQKDEVVKKDDIEKVELEQKNIEDINTEIQKEIDSLKLELEEKNRLEESLKNEQEKNAQDAQKFSELQESKATLEKELSTKEKLLSKNNEELEGLREEQSLKEYALDQNIRLQQALKEKTDSQTEQKIVLFAIVTGVFIALYLLRIVLEKYVFSKKILKKKYAHHFAVFDVLGVFFYIGFLIWFLFYVKPDLMVYLLFLMGAMVIVLQEYIFSLISSIFIVNSYQIGSRIRFLNREGVIEKITLLKIYIRNIDEQGTNIDEMRIVPNSKFMKEIVSILPKGRIEQTSFVVILPKDFSIDIGKITTKIEQDILIKNISMTSYNEITESKDLYSLDFSFSETGNPKIEIIWHESRKNNAMIKRKILELIQKMAPNTTKK